MKKTVDISVLYVEDKDQLRIDATELLQQSVLHVKSTRSAVEALELFKAEPVDVIITDIRMPHMSGLEFIKKIREYDTRVKVIVTSAFNDQNALVEAIDLKIEKFLLKPFDISQLTKILKSLEHSVLQERLEYKVQEQNHLLEAQKEEFESIFKYNLDGIAIVDLESHFLKFNDAYLRCTGYAREELLTKSCHELTIEEDRPLNQKVFQEVIEKGSMANFEKRCVAKNGTRYSVNISVALMPDKQRLLLSVRDVTQERKMQRELDLYMQMIDENVMTMLTDLKGTILDVSEAYRKIAGYERHELLGQNIRMFRHPDMPKSLFADLWKSIQNDEVWEGEIKNRGKDGGHYWVHTKIYPVFNDENIKTGYRAIRHNITNQKLVEELSITDALTKVYNRRHFDTIFPNFFKMVRRKNEVGCFIILDIDYFKKYNDNYGHLRGDEVLVDVATAINETLQRSDDYVFRVGGEEFGILYKTISIDKSLQLARLIHQNIEALQIQNDASDVSDTLSASMGLVMVDSRELIDPEVLYKIADDLLYQAKKSGRNTIVYEIIQ